MRRRENDDYEYDGPQQRRRRLDPVLPSAPDFELLSQPTRSATGIAQLTSGINDLMNSFLTHSDQTKVSNTGNEYFATYQNRDLPRKTMSPEEVND